MLFSRADAVTRCSSSSNAEHVTGRKGLSPRADFVATAFWHRAALFSPLNRRIWLPTLSVVMRELNGSVTPRSGVLTMHGRQHGGSRQMKLRMCVKQRRQTQKAAVRALQAWMQAFLRRKIYLSKLRDDLLKPTGQPTEVRNCR